jgi:O-antigen/teichoic acid export membrane protein
VTDSAHDWRAAGRRFNSVKGPLLVSAGMGVLGVGSYGFLILAGRTLPGADFGRLSALWAAVFGIVGGLSFPFEQEAVRAVAAFGRGPDVTRLVVSLGVTVACLGTGTLAWLHYVSPAGDASLLGNAASALLIALVGLPFAGLVRGILIGAERFAPAAGELALEGLLRAGAAVVLFGRSAGLGAFAITLASAPLISAAAFGGMAARIPRSRAPGRSWSLLLRELATLALGSGIALVVLNVGPLLVALLADFAGAGRFAAGFTLARLPVFFAGPVAASVLPRFVRSHGAGSLQPDVRRAVLLLLPVVAAGALAIGMLTPLGVSVLYGGRYAFAYAVGMVLALSAGVHLVDIILQASLLAADRRGRIVAAWLTGLAALLVLTALGPGSVDIRVAVSYLISAIVTGAVMLLPTNRHPVRRSRVSPSPAG